LILFAVLFGGIVVESVIGSPFILLATILLMIVLFVVNIFLMPFFGGNLFLPGKMSGLGDGFICQVTLTPRRFTGLEGLLEDADDFGMFRIEGDYVVFQGTSLYIAVHKADLIGVDIQKIGWRVFWLMGNAALFTLSQPLSGFSSFRVYPRHGATLISAQKANKAFFDYLYQYLFTAPDAGQGQ